MPIEAELKAYEDSRDEAEWGVYGRLTERPRLVVLNKTDIPEGQDLADIYASAEVFVFPSRTDTFGLVLLEALASGLPIAGFPVDSTRDVIAGAPVAVLDDDLRSACLQSLALSRTACRSYAKTMTWDESARCFLSNLKSSGALLARREPKSGLVSA